MPTQSHKSENIHDSAWGTVYIHIWQAIQESESTTGGHTTQLFNVNGEL